MKYTIIKKKKKKLRKIYRKYKNQSKIWYWAWKLHDNRTLTNCQLLFVPCERATAISSTKGPKHTVNSLCAHVHAHVLVLRQPWEYSVCGTGMSLCPPERDLSASPAVFPRFASLSPRACLHQLYRGSSSVNSNAIFPPSGVPFALKLFFL